jgi:hypothetical protein
MHTGSAQPGRSKLVIEAGTFESALVPGGFYLAD